MRFTRLTLERSVGDRETRVFEARLPGYLTADRLWEVPTTPSRRPKSSR